MAVLRLAPPKTPSFAFCLTVSAAALAAAILIRLAILGVHQGLGLSVTYLPAMIVATLYAGGRWGWATLATAVALHWISPSAVAGAAALPLLALFVAAGAVTVLVGSGFRSSLLDLEAARVDLEATRRELEKRESQLRLTQEAGGVGLWDWNVVTGEGRWSPMVYRNLGLDPSGPADMHAMFAAIHPEDRQGVQAANRKVVKQGRMDPVEYRAVHPDGSVRWLLSRGEVLRDETGRIVRAVGVNIDVSERRVAYEQVRQSEARFRALADSAPILMWVTRTDGRREFANRTYVDFLGVDYEEAIDFDWRKVLHPDDLARILEEQVRGEAARELFTLEARYRRADGEYRWVRSISQPRWAPDGAFAGFVGVGFDVSDSKKAEADLKGINDLLAERVQAALAERDQAQAALMRAQKLEAVGQLTGGVAHDFNNLLTVVIGALDLMQRHPDDVARRDRMIEAAQAAARRGERLTQQLLAFSRRQALKPEPVRVDTLLADSEALLGRAVGEAVTLRLAPGAPEAVCNLDPSQFEAAVMNLVVNARDATPNGGQIRLETLVARLAAGQVEDLAAGRYLCVAVHDTGAGMDPATVARVFEPFFTTKAPGRGTGLGLSQVYGFARQSGGAATLDSAPGKGTSVYLYLPLVSAAAEAEDAGPTALAPARSPALAVLLVEDDAEVGDMVESMLVDLGHAVRRAENAAAALKVLKRGAKVDLMLTDLIMPGDKTGVDLAREAVRLRPALPIILASGYTGETLVAAEDAPWPLLRKPFGSEQLASLIAQVLEPAPEPV